MRLQVSQHTQHLKTTVIIWPCARRLGPADIGGPWAQTHSNHLTGSWESKATARLANTPVDRAIPNNSISGPVIYSRSLVPPPLKTADISPKQGLTTFLFT